jgi:hypothetical protein
MKDDDWLIMRVMRLPHERGTATGTRKPIADQGQSRMQAWIAGLTVLGYETYYPALRELRRVPRRELSPSQRNLDISIMRARVLPFLPGLVFTPARDDAMRLAGHPGVLGFLAVGSEPARVPQWWIDRLRERERAGGGAIPGATPVEYIFAPGDQVRVVSSAFVDRKGIVTAGPECAIEEIDARTRLRLTIDIFGRQTPATLTVADVIKLKSHESITGRSRHGAEL